MPWALYPKLVCVAALLGGFACVLALVLASPLERHADWQALLASVGTLFRWVIVPASFGTALFGVLLLVRARRWFFRRRWARAKLALLVATLPALHLLARGVFTRIRCEVEQGSPEGPTGLLELFTLLVAATIGVLLVALWLARFRPRLGQPPQPPP